MKRLTLALGLLVLAGTLAQVAHADEAQRDLCERRAAAETGYSGNRLPEVRIGPFGARISGSVAVGVSRSSRPEPHLNNPNAGAYAREQYEEKRAEKYERALARCLASR
jgi:hypothetical protein